MTQVRMQQMEWGRRAGLVLLLGVVASVAPLAAGAQATVRLGFNYPRSGASSAEGLDQLRGAMLAVEEVNAAGGILGQGVELVVRDSRSSAAVARANVTELIEREGVRMVFGGAASGVIAAVSELCQEKGVPFFASVSYANSTTGAAGHRLTFRENPNAWMGARALARALGEELAAKRFFYVTADAPGGVSLEESLRQVTGTRDLRRHPGVRVPAQKVPARELRGALEEAQRSGAAVLVLALGGRDLVNTLNMAAHLGLKKTMQVVVPNLTHATAQGAGPRTMAGVLGVVGWDWKVPSARGFTRGQAFVEQYAARFGRYPSAAAASAYTIVHEYKAAVERARSLEAARVVRALEGHTYQLLKDPQTWRGFDHQSVQSVYVVRGNPPEKVLADRYRQDFFEVIHVLPGAEAVRTRAGWEAERRAAGRPPRLEPLPGDR